MFEKQKRWFQNLFGNTPEPAVQTNLPERATSEWRVQYGQFILDYTPKLFEFQRLDNTQHKEALTQNLSKEAQYFCDQERAIGAWYNLLQTETDPLCTKRVMRELEALHVYYHSDLSRQAFAQAILRCGSLTEGEEAAAAIVGEWKDDPALLQLVVQEAEEYTQSTHVDELNEHLSRLTENVRTAMDEDAVMLHPHKPFPNWLDAAMCSSRKEDFELEM